MALLTGYRRLTLPYERKATHFLILGAAITAHKKHHQHST
jgi:hypothetical protein